MINKIFQELKFEIDDLMKTYKENNPQIYNIHTNNILEALKSKLIQNIFLF